MIELSDQEKYIVEMMRERKPYEVIEIRKDKSGRPGAYFVTRTQKLIVDETIMSTSA